MDLIARVYPYQGHQGSDYAKQAIEAIGATGESSRYRRPRVPPPERPKTPLSRKARESTGPLDTHETLLDELPYLELRFSDGPRTSWGLVFGTDHTTSDIVLPPDMAVSRRHFALTYKNSGFDDGRHRLVVRDLGSRFGTQVTYDNEGEGVRRKFDWIIDGFRIPDPTEDIIIQLNGRLKFRIVVAHHDLASPAYVANVERFRQGTANSEDLFNEIRLDSGVSTTRHSGAHTPTHKDPIFVFLEPIANGAFGQVSRECDVSSGKEYACKQPLKNTRYPRELWEREIDIMRKTSHDHIVQLCYWEKMPRPVLYLEYLPLGNLEDEHEKRHFSQECVAILHQSLSALGYLHGQAQPIVHRDIKPQNILVHHRHPDFPHLHIKLSDFGLSKVGDQLKTFCGSKTYCPPEIRDEAEPYTKAVDIWSLGVVVLRFAYDLPHPGSGMGFKWCQKIVQEANDRNPEGLIDILQCMLIIEPEERCSANAGWEKASALVASSQDRSATPTPASYAAGYRTMTPLIAGGREGEEQETLILPCEVTQYIAPDDGEVGSESPRYIRSNTPQPSTRCGSQSSSISSRRRSKRRKSSSVWQVESQSETAYEEGCWLDPLHPVGGGSSLASLRLSHAKSKVACMPSDQSNSVEEPGSLLTDWMQPAENNSLRNTTSLAQDPASGGNNTVQSDEVDVQGTDINSHWFRGEYQSCMCGDGCLVCLGGPADSGCAVDQLAKSLVPNQELPVNAAREGTPARPHPPTRATVRRRKRTSPEDKQAEY